MTVYAIAQLRFTDRAAYDRYQAGFMQVFGQHRGTVLASDESPRVVEGQWDRDKVVLLAFPDEVAFYRFANSPEYREIAKHRHQGADTVLLLVRGLP